MLQENNIIKGNLVSNETKFTILVDYSISKRKKCICGIFNGITYNPVETFKKLQDLEKGSIGILIFKDKIINGDKIIKVYHLGGDIFIPVEPSISKVLETGFAMTKVLNYEKDKNICFSSILDNNLFDIFDGYYDINTKISKDILKMVNIENTHINNYGDICVMRKEGAKYKLLDINRIDTINIEFADKPSNIVVNDILIKIMNCMNYQVDKEDLNTKKLKIIIKIPKKYSDNNINDMLIRIGLNYIMKNTMSYIMRFYSSKIGLPIRKLKVNYIPNCNHDKTNNRYEFIIDNPDITTCEVKPVVVINVDDREINELIKDGCPLP